MTGRPESATILGHPPPIPSAPETTLAASPDDQARTMIANLKDRTGRTLEEMKKLKSVLTSMY